MPAGLDSGPPKWLEGVVARLVPRPCREDVLGDLWERYRSPLRYFLDGVAVVPFLLFMQFRRVLHVGSSLADAVTLLLSFEFARTMWGSTEPTPHVAAAIPAAAGLLALQLRRAYTGDEGRPLARRICDGLFAVACAVVTQMSLPLFAPSLQLPPRVVLMASAISVLLLADSSRSAAERGTKPPSLPPAMD